MFKNIILSLVTFLLTSSMVMAQEITLVTCEWHPLTYDQSQDKGYATEIVNAALTAAGIPSIIKYFPWKRCEEMVHYGTAQATYPYVPTEERKENFLFSEPILYTKRVAFRLKSKNRDWEFKSFEDFKNYRVGVTLGEWIIPKLEAVEARVYPTKNFELNIKKLLENRIDFVTQTDIVGWDIIHTHFPNESHRLVAIDISLDRVASCLMVGKNTDGAKELIRRFNRGLALIKDNGTLEAIKGTYRIH